MHRGGGGVKSRSIRLRYDTEENVGTFAARCRHVLAPRYPVAARFRHEGGALVRYVQRSLHVQPKPSPKSSLWPLYDVGQACGVWRLCFRNRADAVPTTVDLAKAHPLARTIGRYLQCNVSVQCYFRHVWRRRCARNLQLSPKSSVAHHPLFPSQRETKSQSRQDTLSRAPYVPVVPSWTLAVNQAVPKLGFSCEQGLSTSAKVRLWLGA